MWYKIYRHTSPSGKSYIGITSEDTYTRFRKHLRKARFGSTTNFHKAIRKYGEDCWQSEILDAFYTEDKKEAYEKEQSWIDSEQPEYNMDCGFGWNITDRRGDKNPMYGKLSGNAHGVSIKGEIFLSLTLAAEHFSVNRGTISRWIKSREDCFKLN
ncbi:homing endonuclease [Alteromonas phage vB_AmaP_AD45-P2]|uniref:GIY-YIG domain-containing protein n=1 Tax=Pseudorhizobium pelagicum TaxID=1509405 RepID=A0A922T7B6_9HYPH|nr:GIY-YIG nuclease family protein [Pseudorhizobium pelagicum]YP_008126063.1 GIY-YIG nuclease family protein [Alteromonas phage vB_AmaP_AD45-P1]AGM47026.1 homing endonuclease [Alteromonas phage vB_AmaP_AD45-P3]AGM47142.1 homing endonuclease [Alteromonas phage vB_AmaP_AD45-P4]AGM47264.1 homing endonuclease [Alteromonas phage vB_AmaP_AD45-P2]AGM46910.1 homing endonuclease [Alteromonas phage vB_AmaP_AD45-P1]KEQ05616.1 hypothetical protein GV68_08795 [Pseudorhizobium pelagicum]